MTRLDALRMLLAAPRVEADLGRIGYRVIEAEADPRRIRLSYAYKILTSVLRRAA